MKKIVVFVSLFLVSTFSAFADFSDVSSCSTYYDGIKWMSDNDAIVGYSDGTFKPLDPVNRAEFLKMVYLAQGLESVIPAVQTDSGFSDVEAGSWYAKYVAYAKSKGTIAGYGDGTFRPGQNISRAEAFKIIMKDFFGDEPDNYINGLTAVEKSQIVGCFNNYLSDVEAGSWYANSINFAHSKCIIPPQMIYDLPAPVDDLVYPWDNMNRGETAEVLYRSFMVKENDGDLFLVESGQQCDVEWQTYSDDDISFQYPKTFLGTSLEESFDENLRADEWEVLRQDDTIYIRPNFESPAEEGGATYELKLLDDLSSVEEAALIGTLIPGPQSDLGDPVANIEVDGFLGLWEDVDLGMSGVRDIYVLRPFETDIDNDVFMYITPDIYSNYVEDTLIPSIVVK